MLSRLWRDYGFEHKWAYAASGLMLAIGAGTTALAAALLRPVLTAWRRRRDDEMRILAFAVLDCLSCADSPLMARWWSFAHGKPDRRTVQARVFDHLLRQNILYFQDLIRANSSRAFRLPANGVRDALQVMVRAWRATSSA